MAADESAVAAAWDANASRWGTRDDALRSIFEALFFDDFLPDLRGCSVIDLGCGTGRMTRILARRGMKVTAVDISEKMLEVARGSEAREPLGIDYRLSSFISLAEFAEGEFDHALSIGAFMDAPHFAGAARAIHRALRPGGSLYFTVMHPLYKSHGATWMRDPNGKVAGRLIGDYWRASWIDRMNDAATGATFEIPRFGHRIETYINGVCQAGFRLTRLSEPRPSEEMVRRVPAAGLMRAHVPMWLFVAAAKAPGAL